jgi:hypothetical protein
VRLAEGELQTTQDDATRMRRLLERRAGAQGDYEQAVAKLRQAKEKLKQARLPVDEGRVAILQKAMKVLEKGYAVKREELAMKQQVKQGELTPPGSI